MSRRVRVTRTHGGLYDRPWVVSVKPTRKANWPRYVALTDDEARDLRDELNDTLLPGDGPKQLRLETA